jgi:type I restriction-modification system DNA methylase subunit
MSDFQTQVLDAFGKVRSEIDSGSSEYDIRHRFIKYLVEGLWGYEGKDYRAEKDKTDVKIYDETHNLLLVVIETKKLSVDLRDEKWKDQAFGYSDSFTKYVVLTNGLQLLIWTKNNRDKAMVDVDFDAILGEKRFTPEKLTATEKSQLSFLWELSREELWGDKKYDDFAVSEKTDISTDDGFQSLIEKLHFVMDQLLMGYAVRTYNDYLQGYKKYLAELKSLDAERENTKGNKELEVALEKEKRDIEEKNKRFIDFKRGFEEWLKLSDREDNDESIGVFCKETIYVLLNKLLLARICEDKGLVQKKLSNSGILRIRELFTYLRNSYRDLLDFAYRDISQLYSHVFERSIFDWYTEGNGELNKVLNRTLYVLNHFDFGQVNRDILGKLYEKYLPKEERKKFGGFYTPEEVIDYILDTVGYTADQEIEGKDLLDPACGSGGFLVRAVGRLIDRYKVKGLGPKELLKNVASHIYGLDIDPFACHIAEMNILFQVIDLYQKAREEDQSFQLPRFNIYQTDSLELPKTAKALTQWQYPNSRVQKYIQEKETIETIKNKKFDFVVGNPPYVKTLRWFGAELSEYYRKVYETAYWLTDLYMLFIERGFKWLEKGGTLGFICSNQFMTRKYGKDLRTYLATKSSIRQIVDFGDSGVFKDVTNYPCILILESSSHRGSFKCATVISPKQGILQDISEHVSREKYSSKFFRIFSLDQKKLASKVWSLAPPDEREVLEKIATRAQTTLKEKLADITSGIKIGKDNLFIVKAIREIDTKHVEVMPVAYRKEGKTIPIEKDLLMPILRGRNVRKWGLIWHGFYTIFPHLMKNGKLVAIAEDEMKREYPNAYTYLQSHRSELESRLDWGKSPVEIHGVWYAVMHPGRLENYVQPKILTPALTDRTNFALDMETHCYVSGTAGVLGILPRQIDSKYLLALLNSKVFDFFLKHVSPIKAGGYSQYSAETIGNLPIRLPESHDEKKIAEELVEHVEQILALAEKLRTSEEAKEDFTILLKGLKITRLDDYPSVVFSISSNKVADIRREGKNVFLNLTDNIECGDELVAKYVELCLKSKQADLKRTEDLKKEVCDISIPKHKQKLREVLKRHDSTEKEIKELPGSIENLEKEIDQRVYRLYGLSKDSIYLVEENS